MKDVDKRLYEKALNRISLLKKRLNYIEGCLDSDNTDSCIFKEIRRLVTCKDVEIENFGLE